MSKKIWMRQQNLVNVSLMKKKIKIAPKFPIVSWGVFNFDLEKVECETCKSVEGTVKVS